MPFGQNRPTAILLDVRRQVVQRTVSCCVRALFGGLLNGSRDHHQSAASARPVRMAAVPDQPSRSGVDVCPLSIMALYEPASPFMGRMVLVNKARAEPVGEIV